MPASLGVRMQELITIGQFEPVVYFNLKFIKNKPTRLKAHFDWFLRLPNTNHPNN